MADTDRRSGMLVRASARAADLLCRERTMFVLAVLAISALAIWLVWPVTRGGIIVNQDAPRHLLRAKVMAEQFLPAGHVDGWSPYWFLGAQLFLFQSYGYFAVIGAAALALQEQVTLHAVFKLFYVLPVVLLPAAVAHLARRLGIGRSGAAVAALAAILFGTNLGYGMRGLFYTGLLIQAAGIVVFALAWPAVLDVIDGRRGSTPRAVLLTAAILVVHFISGAYALAAAGLIAAAVAVSRRDVRVLLRYALAAAVVVLLAGHTLFPTLELHDRGGVAVGWGDAGARLDRFVTGELFGPPLLVLPGYLAAFWCIARRRGPLAWTAATMVATGLVALSGPFAWEPEPVRSVLGTLIRPRAIPYACLFTAVFAGLAYERAALVLGRWLAGRRARPWMAAAVCMLAVAVVASQAWPQLRGLRRLVKTEASFRGEGRLEYMRIVAWLRRHAPKRSILAVDRRGFEFADLGTRSVVSMLNLHTGLYTLAGDQAELTSAARRSPRADLNAARKLGPAAQHLRSYGVRYVIVTTEEARRRYDQAADFRSVFRDEHATVYELADGAARLSGTDVRALRFRETPEQLRWEVQSPRAAKVTLAVSPHPNWVARIDGKPVQLFRTRESLMRLTVPKGRHRLELTYERRASERLYNWISLGTLLAVLAAWARTWRRGPRDGRRLLLSQISFPNVAALPSRTAKKFDLTAPGRLASRQHPGEAGCTTRGDLGYRTCAAENRRGDPFPMMTVAVLTIGLLTWVAFIYVMYHYGDRPVSVAWYAAMVSLGVLEYGKAVLGLVELGVSPLPVAIIAAASAGGFIYYRQSRHEAGRPEGLSLLKA